MPHPFHHPRLNPGHLVLRSWAFMSLQDNDKRYMEVATHPKGQKNGPCKPQWALLHQPCMWFQYHLMHWTFLCQAACIFGIWHQCKSPLLHLCWHKVHKIKMMDRLTIWFQKFYCCFPYWRSSWPIQPRFSCASGTSSHWSELHPLHQRTWQQDQAHLQREYWYPSLLECSQQFSECCCSTHFWDKAQVPTSFFNLELHLAARRPLWWHPEQLEFSRKPQMLIRWY